ncbi:MAG TPA: LuxR family transcriptional regulator [Gammaproteobacteria bacterium]|jgi:DNA-binding CsgD family transcriptional regulator
MSDDIDSKGYYALGIVLFGAIFLLIAWDLAYDYSQGRSWGHLLIELTVLLFAAGGIGLLLHRLYLVRATVYSLGKDLARARQDAERWRNESRELIDGLRAAIDRQFGRWNLSPAEAEIGLLLLKGLSHKELAGIRNTSERTVREQARALYRKAGLDGRASLSAFFLEDLLLPGRPERGHPDENRD